MLSQKPSENDPVGLQFRRKHIHLQIHTANTRLSLSDGKPALIMRHGTLIVSIIETYTKIPVTFKKALGPLDMRLPDDGQMP